MSKQIFTRLTLAFVLFLSLAAFKVQGQATVTTDQMDYPPGSTVIITGTGFQAGETVKLQVTHTLENGDNDTSPAHEPFNTVADADGNITSSWLVPSDQDEIGATLKLTADGQTSLLHAEATFTDANFTATTSGAWNVGATWGNNGNNVAGSGYPGVNDAAAIPGNLTVTLSTAESCISVTVGGGSNFTTGILKFNSGSVLTVSGNVTIGSNGNRRGSLDMANGGILKIGGSFTAPNLNTYSPGSGTIEYNRAGSQTVLSTSVLGAAYNNLTISGGNTKTLGGDVTVTSSLTISSLTTLELNSNNITSGDLQGTGILTNSNNGGALLTTGSDNLNTTFSGTIQDASSNNISLTKTGSGILTLSGSNSYRGATTISNGTLSVNTLANSGTNSSIGTGSSTSTISISATGTLLYTGTGHSSNRVIILTGDGGTIDASGSGTLNLTGGVTGNNNNLTLSGTGSGIETGVINTISGTVTKTGSGTWTVSGNNTYTGTTTVSAGILRLGAANVISNSSNFILNGGTFGTGGANGFSETVGILNLADNSTIALGTGSHTLTFSNSSAVVWTGGKKITITGWTGTGGSSGTSGKIVVGAGGLTATQLSNINFTGYAPGAIILAGEVVPVGASVITSALTSNSNYGTASSYQITGSNNPTSFNATGLPTGVTLNSSTGLISVAANTSAGTYSINISSTNGSGTGSNVLSYTVNKVALTVVNTNRSKVYGVTLTNSDYTGSITGIVAGDVITVARASTGDAANATIAGSTYPIVGTLADPGSRLANYNVTNNNGALTVTKAPLTVVNTNRSKVYGVILTNSDYTGSVTGIVAGDVITVTRASTGDAANATVAGSTYPIVGTLADPGSRLANYNVTNNNGALTVTKATAAVTVNGYTGVYDAAAHGAIGSVTGVDAGGTAAGAVLNLGASFTDVPGGTANWTFTGGTNYTDQSGTAAIVITKATATVTVNGYTGVYDAAVHGATGSATGVDAGGTAVGGVLNLGASFTNVPGGTASWTFIGGTNYTDQSGTAAITITKAVATVSVSGYIGVYDAAAHGATGSATGVGGVDLSAGLNLGASFTDVPGGSANWTFTGGTNYTDQSGTAAIVITKATATVTVNGYTGVYDAAAHGATGSATGVDAGVTAAGGMLNLGASFTNVPGGTASWTFIGGTNYTDQSGTAAIVITKATATVTVNGYTGVYDAAAHGATGFATGVDAGVTAAGGVLNLGASFTNVPGGTASWTFAGGTNYTDQSGTAAIMITKATATVTVNGYTGVYDATAHGATGSVTGVDAGGTAVGGVLNLGASFTNVPGGTANWTFTGGANYTDQTGTVAIVITKATAIVTVNGYTGVYDAAAHGATGSATGVGGVALPGLNLGASFTDVPGGTANWTFTGGTNYTDQTGTVAIVITKATAIVTINGYTGVYDAAAHGATGSATGVDAGGTAVGGVLNLGALFTNVPGGTASWTFTGGTNYTDQSGTAAITITKAVATVSVSGYTGVYDAAAHGATGTATGVDAGGTAAGGILNLGASFTDVPGGTANWTFAGGTNYADQNGTAAIVITKATATVTVNGYTGVYDAAAHGASGSATGVGGVVLPGLNLGASFTDVPGGTASWTFTGGTNYTDQSGTAAITITKAVATVSVSGYTGVYDAAAHGATGSATGVGGVALPGLSLGASFTDVPGGTANWTFTGGTNYTDQGGTAAIVITKATAIVTVNGYTGVYDAAAHGATGSATGVGGVPLAGINLAASFTNVPGGTANWTFTGGANYTDQSGSVAIVINKASLTVTANSKSKYCGQAIPALDGTLTGVLGSDGITATYSTVATQASPAGTYSITPALVDPNGKLGNYLVTSINGTFTINAILTVDLFDLSPVPFNTPITLYAIVKPVAAGIPVDFYIDASATKVGTGVTGADGKASFTISAGKPEDVYGVVASVGGCATSTSGFLPVYDPSKGFAAGNGSILSPTGAYPANTLYTARGRFGFSVKYKKGSILPQGELDFQLKKNNFKFESTGFQWLVIAGNKAQFMGTGKINGSGTYNFTVTAIDNGKCEIDDEHDGDIDDDHDHHQGFDLDDARPGYHQDGKKCNDRKCVTPDQFRIRITTTAGVVVYDNQMGMPVDGYAASSITRGALEVNDLKVTTRSVGTNTIATAPAATNLNAGVKLEASVMPNPTTTVFNLVVKGKDASPVTVRVTDVYGNLVQLNQKIGSSATVRLGERWTNGTYFVEVMQGTERKLLKVIKAN